MTNPLASLIAMNPTIVLARFVCGLQSMRISGRGTYLGHSPRRGLFPKNFADYLAQPLHEVGISIPDQIDVLPRLRDDFRWKLFTSARHHCHPPQSCGRGDLTRTSEIGYPTLRGAYPRPHS